MESIQLPGSSQYSRRILVEDFLSGDMININLNLSCLTFYNLSCTEPSDHSYLHENFDHISLI